MKHTGKSRHGEALARALGRVFCDTDTLIREIDAAAGAQRVRTARDIYLEDGAERFRQLETAAFRLVAEREEPIVIATGGGLCDNEDAVRSTSGGMMVHLVDSFEAISDRIFRRGIPAFLYTTDEQVGRKRFREIYDRRTAAYDAMADVRVELTGMSPSCAETRLIEQIRRHLHGGQ